MLILMSVSFSFSVAIYRGMTAEVDRFAQIQRLRIERRFDDAGLPRPPVIIDKEMVEEIKQHIVINFLGINGVIFIVMGGLAYFLAGKTLHPIQEMVEEQHRFVSDASHELKTPLTAMKSALEVYVRDPKMTLREARQVLQDNIEDVNRLQSLSESLLTLLENHSNTKHLSFTKVSSKTIIEKAIHQMKYNAEKKKIIIRIESIPDVMLKGNEEKLVSIFTILLDNAIKYSTEKTAITITGKIIKKGVELSVKDQGIGIAEKDISRVFDRFYRSDEARRKAEVGGYGLGLPIAKKIIEYHNGRISIESKVNTGTTVLVWLPKI